MTKRLACAVDGCLMPPQRDGLCWPHTAQRLYGWPVYTARSRQCNYPDCLHPSHSGGYCRNHTQQITETGIENLRPAPVTVCETRGCPLTARASGLCWPHWLATTGRQPAREPVGRVCNFPDCDRPHFTWGYCDSHHKQINRVGIDNLHPIYVTRCKVDGCTLNATRDALCVPHHMQEAYGYMPSSNAHCNYNRCHRTKRKGGFCVRHWKLVLTLGPEDAYQKTIPHLCLIYGCKLERRIGHLCVPHHMRQAYGWDFQLGPGVECNAPGCDRPQKQGGYCYAHHVLVKATPQGADVSEFVDILTNPIARKPRQFVDYNQLANDIDSQPWLPAWLLMADTGAEWLNLERGLLRIGRDDLAKVARGKREEHQPQQQKAAA